MQGHIAQIQKPCSAIDWRLGVFLISVLMASRKQLKCHSLHLKSILICVWDFFGSLFIHLCFRKIYFTFILLLVDLLRGSAPVTYIGNLTPDFSWCEWQCFKLSCPPCNYFFFFFFFNLSPHPDIKKSGSRRQVVYIVGYAYVLHSSPIIIHFELKVHPFVILP